VEDGFEELQQVKSMFSGIVGLATSSSPWNLGLTGGPARSIRMVPHQPNPRKAPAIANEEDDLGLS